MSIPLAVVPVRAGVLPAGGAEAVAEAGGRALLIGDAAAAAAVLLTGIATEVRALEAGGFAPARWTAELAPVLADEPLVILPGSPDGRDLAPRLAAALERPLHAGAMRITTTNVTTIVHGGRVLAEHVVHGPVVATLQPGVRGAVAGTVPLPDVVMVEPAGPEGTTDDATVEEVLPADVATMDLSEAPRILGGGAGLDSSERFAQLARVALRLDASMGATRVVTDRGWLPHTRQIGTTGVVVDPRLYLAFGISGAVQHTAGLGTPDHVISVNVDPHCPMMELADLAVVADANRTVDELERLLAEGAVGGHGGELLDERRDERTASHG
jgi:electron transfer flavoprotein alpha subunit